MVLSNWISYGEKHLDNKVLSKIRKFAVKACDVAFTGKLCNRPLGMQNRRIKNVAITSSSRWDNHHAPYLARLQNQRRGRYMGGWSAGANNAFQWLQIDLGRPTKIVRISTQGRPTVNQWVTSYYLLYSQDGVYFAFYFERNTKKVGCISGYSYTAIYCGCKWTGKLVRKCETYFTISLYSKKC